MFSCHHFGLTFLTFIVLTVHYRHLATDSKWMPLQINTFPMLAGKRHSEHIILKNRCHFLKSFHSFIHQNKLVLKLMLY